MLSLHKFRAPDKALWLWGEGQTQDFTPGGDTTGQGDWGMVSGAELEMLLASMLSKPAFPQVTPFYLLRGPQGTG